jgi:translation elongation factor EF-G
MSFLPGFILEVIQIKKIIFKLKGTLEMLIIALKVSESEEDKEIVFRAQQKLGMKNGLRYAKRDFVDEVADQLVLSIIETLENQISEVKEHLENKLKNRKSGEDELNEIN